MEGREPRSGLKCLEYWDSAVEGGRKQSTSSEKVESQAKILDSFVQTVL